MKAQNLKKYIFNYACDPTNKDNIKLYICLLLSMLMTLIYLIFDKPSTTQVREDLKVNLNVLIPEGHILYPFEAENYDKIEPLLEAYNMVKVYSPSGQLLAENIKVLRAPKDPSSLAFLIPVNIAKSFAPMGLEFRIALQKYTSSKKPKLIAHKKTRKSNLKISFGG